MSFGIYGGVGYFSGFPLFFVPYPAACPEHRAIEGHHSPTVRPRSYQRDQMSPQLRNGCSDVEPHSALEPLKATTYTHATDGMQEAAPDAPEMAFS